MKRNEVYVTTDLQDEGLWSREINFTSAHWINEEPKDDQELLVRTRHRGDLIKVKKLNMLSVSKSNVRLEKDVRALTPGQSVVFYAGDECLGGGIVI